MLCLNPCHPVSSSDSSRAGDPRESQLARLSPVSSFLSTNRGFMTINQRAFIKLETAAINVEKVQQVRRPGPGRRRLGRVPRNAGGEEPARSTIPAPHSSASREASRHTNCRPPSPQREAPNSSAFAPRGYRSKQPTRLQVDDPEAFPYPPLDTRTQAEPLEQYFDEGPEGAELSSGGVFKSKTEAHMNRRKNNLDNRSPHGPQRVDSEKEEGSSS